VAVNKVGIVAAVAASGALVLAGAALANAATGTTAPRSVTAGATDTERGTAGDGGQGSNDTPVTGDELAKVTAAMKAKDSAVTVTSVRKDPDGSYDVLGSKAGAAVMFDVSADLKTFSQHAGGGGGGRGHGGGHGDGGQGSNDTPVTGAELAKVTAAMKAKDSTVAVTGVRKDPDGSYDVLGSKAGAAVMFDVSADLKTFSQHTGGGGRGHGGDDGTTSGGSGTSSSTSSPQT
jgi:hypothetical protein